jgi:hypothetical protein
MSRSTPLMPFFVIQANAGIQTDSSSDTNARWIPACAGMTEEVWP